MAHRFFNFQVAAKGAVLTTICCTALLRLYAPTSLTYVASQSAVIFDVAASVLLGLALIGWLDIFVTDAFGRKILKSIDGQSRHKLCTMYYGFIAGVYMILCFVGLDVSVPQHWILLGNYFGVSVFTLVLAIAIAFEDRKPGG